MGYIGCIRVFGYSLLLALLFSVAILTGCTIVRVPDGVYYTFGQATIEHCTTIEGEVNECYKLETKGLSGEFAGIVKALFGWLPGL